MDVVAEGGGCSDTHKGLGGQETPKLEKGRK